MITSTSTPGAPPRRIRVTFRAILGLAAYLFVGLGVLFLAGGDSAWPAAWAYSGLNIVAIIGSRLIALKLSPGMLAERAHALEAKDVPAWDRGLVFIVALGGPVTTLLVAGLDHRLGWPPSVGLAVQVTAGAVLILAYAFSTWAMIANPFFSAVVRIQTERGHHVVRSGPYGVVRHPAYAAGLVATLAGSLMLDSVWSLIPAAGVAAATVIRTALEDRTLQERLPGYREYGKSVRFRLLPGVW
jgi:protein-S-isoprenylcysteine O-methyltransferase Ste14